ncbi:ATPase family associated with various cellular activities (AAA) [Nakamurella panacisegetis]|uniref:ATPase family associated with various cellular activities (AAA) n=1 Tax=Nakamurella panacisegetis TaxID=1090615 RepID=A0A1H0JH64_9ACTN|nr:ATPase family associated with various cellular activities (AAA) [Nakamurella panacisegetis]
MVIAAALSDVLAAVQRAADRRDLTGTPPWEAVARALQRDHPETGESDGSPLPVSDPLLRMASVFGLGRAEGDLLLAAAAPDLDPNFAHAYGLLLGAVGPQPASAALLLELAGIPLLSGAGRALLGQTAPLRRWGLLHLQTGPLNLGRSVTVGEDVVGALVGHPVQEPVSLAMTVDPVDPDELPASEAAAQLAAALSAGTRLSWIEDPVGAAGVATAVAAFAQAEIACSVFDLARRPAGVGLIAAALAAVRRAGLLATAVVLTGAEALVGDDTAAEAVALLSGSPVPVVLIGRCRWNPAWRASLPVVVRAVALDPDQRVRLWRKHVAAEQVPAELLVPYRLTPEQITAAGRHVVAQAGLAGRPVDSGQVAETVRLLGGSGRFRPGSGAARTSYDDLQLPPETLNSLHRLGDWVRLRDSVISRGPVHGAGGKGTGIAALFTGGPGTGKTLAAHVIADTAGLDLMQVDLSGVIDKYIGETEKNLERVFAEAENLNVVLFFDEADALFGSRSEVKDAKDRYANQEVSYLLQRMEHFNGITVLATNLRGNLDAAFARRMHFIIHFPDPDAATRRQLLGRLLDRVGELDESDPLDLDYLATTIELAGGDLRNIVLAAAYDAAIDGTGVGSRHVLAATLREYAKLGRRAPAGLLP